MGRYGIGRRPLKDETELTIGEVVFSCVMKDVDDTLFESGNNTGVDGVNIFLLRRTLDENTQCWFALVKDPRVKVKKSSMTLSVACDMEEGADSPEEALKTLFNNIVLCLDDYATDLGLRVEEK